jgi:YD repeat-containing protein
VSRQTIKDSTGRLLGSIDDGNPNGSEWAYDSQGKVLGSFDPQTNTTKTATGKLLAKGNGLAGLIFGRRG